MKRISRKQVLQQARRLADQHGEMLTLTMFEKATGVSQHYVRKLFGRWSDLRVEVGLSAEAPRRPKTTSKETILDIMQNTVAEHGDQLTLRQFSILTGISAAMVTDRFGSWGALREAVGLNRRVKPKSRYSNDDLMLDLYKVYRIYREKPFIHKHRHRGGKISICTFQIRFGSWEGTLAAFKAYLRRHGVYANNMPLPEELEKKFNRE